MSTILVNLSLFLKESCVPFDSKLNISELWTEHEHKHISPCPRQ